MRLHPARAVGLLRAPWIPGWSKDSLWRRARAVPSLDLRFADNKSLVDATTGQNLVTFSRASGGTYVDSQGVIRNATTNLLLRSEEFDNASWAKARCSITQNAIAAPDGNITADLLIEDTSLNSHRLLSTAAIVTANTTVTFSVYFKSKERTQIQLYVDEVTGAGGASFSAFFSSSGASGGLASGGATYTSGSVQALGGGWYRAVITGTLAGGYTSYRCSVFPAASGNIHYQGDGTSGIYIWGAQLEQSSTVGEYIPTTSAINSAPRFDHNPSTGESLGLLVEEARTNSIRNNTMVGAVAGTPGTLPTNWTTSGAGSITEIIGTGTEDGITYIDVRFSGTVSNTNLNFETAIAATTSQAWSGSVYLKLLSGSIAGTWRMAANEFGSGGSYLRTGLAVNIAPTAASLANQRLTGSFTTGASTQTLSFLLNGLGSGQAVDFTLRIGLPQLEQGAFATSVILTTGTAATRAADIAEITGTNFSSWYSQSEGTVFAEITPRGIAAQNYAYAIDLANSFANSHLLYAVNGSPRAETFVGSVIQAQITGNLLVINQVRRFANIYRLNDFALASNGALSGTDVSGSLPAPTSLKIGTSTGGLFPLNGTLKRLTFWPQRLSNSTLQSITQ